MCYCQVMAVYKFFPTMCNRHEYTRKLKSLNADLRMESYVGPDIIPAPIHNMSVPSQNNTSAQLTWKRQL